MAQLVIAITDSPFPSLDPAKKALARLSWRPRLNVRAALAWTADWYREYNKDAGCGRALGQLAHLILRKASTPPPNATDQTV